MGCFLPPRSIEKRSKGAGETYFKRVPYSEVFAPLSRAFRIRRILSRNYPAHFIVYALEVEEAAWRNSGIPGTHLSTLFVSITRCFCRFSAAMALLGSILLSISCSTAPSEPSPPPESIPEFKNIVQTGGIRIAYPEGWGAHIPADAEKDTLVLYEGHTTGYAPEDPSKKNEDALFSPFEATNFVHIDKISLENPEEFDRWKFSTFLAAEICGGEDAHGPLQWVRLNGRDTYTFAYEGGVAGLVYENQSVWVLNAEGEAFAPGASVQPSYSYLDIDVSTAFFGLLDSFDPNAPTVSARRHSKGLLFVELEHWYWVDDIENGFTLAAGENSFRDRKNSDRHPVFATIRFIEHEPAIIKEKSPEDELIAVDPPLMRFQLVHREETEKPALSHVYLLRYDENYIEVTLYGLREYEGDSLLEHKAVRELIDHSLSVVQ